MDDLVLARSLFGMTMGFHIIFATLGVGLPLMMIIAELMYQKTKDIQYVAMAKRWTKTFAILLGVGIPTGTIAGTQLSLLWPGFMEVIGKVMILPFQIEIYAFFIEALFMSIYVYAAERLPPWMRTASLVLVAFGAMASAVLISNVHSFEGTPAGFRMENGNIVDIEPWKAFFNPSFAVTAVHVVLSAYTTGAFAIGAVAAYKMLRGGRKAADYSFHKKALKLCAVVGGLFALFTALNGHFVTQNLYHHQPEKLAAAEGLFETRTHAPLTVLGISDREEEKVKYGVEIPWLLSFLSGNSFDTEVKGLKDFPEEFWPPLFVHTLFNIMFITGSLLILLGFYSYWKHVRKKKEYSKWMLLIFILAGPMAMAAIEAGWIFACTGRQPWTIYRILSTADSVTTATNLGTLFTAFAVVYAVLGIAVVSVLLYYFRRNSVQDELGRLADRTAAYESNS